MEVVHTIADVRRLVSAGRAAGKSVGLVPTMGALHAGHASLVDAARSGSGLVAVSIFVNPTQFGPNEDFSRYPRTLQADCDLCRSHGADVVFAPAVDEMYPQGGGLTDVAVRKLADTLCGASRPGHFKGVCTVVSKLFNIVLPDNAYFGAKDYQQATIIRRMVVDLNFPVNIVVCPIVREVDGLAMSSRNRYLSPEHRRQAVVLSGSLKLAREMILSRRSATAEVLEAMRRYIAQNAPDGAIDYIEAVNPDTLESVDNTNGSVVVALAVKFGATRLIDNMKIDLDSAGH